MYFLLSSFTVSVVSVSVIPLIISNDSCTFKLHDTNSKNNIFGFWKYLIFEFSDTVLACFCSNTSPVKVESHSQKPN